MNELERLRKKIDALDEKIIDLLNRRARTARRIGKLKSRGGERVYVPEREREIYRKIVRSNRGPLSGEALKAVYREIMSAALSLEKKLKIAYLGPQFTFSHLASLRKFGSRVGYVACESISDCFTEVERGRCDFSVVPIENSIEGAITHTLDMFVDSDLKICAEILLEIEHNLVSRDGRARIRKIYSRPEVFSQCRLWLESNLPRAELIPVSSTTRGAEIAAGEKNAAAIASELAARHYRLDVVAPSIEDSPHNVTRFLVIGKREPKPTGEDKTSIVFSIKDRVGALYSMLLPFKRNRINLNKIESHPSKKKAWDYYFFVDLEGHHEDKKVKKTLAQLDRECPFFKVLGSYPVSD